MSAYSSKYISACYYAALVVLPVVIFQPGEYITRCGEKVTVVTMGGASSKCKGSYPCAIPEAWHRSGRIYSGMLSDNDIVSKA